MVDREISNIEIELRRGCPVHLRAPSSVLDNFDNRLSIPFRLMAGGFQRLRVAKHWYDMVRHGMTWYDSAFQVPFWQRTRLVLGWGKALLVWGGAYACPFLRLTS